MKTPILVALIIVGGLLMAAPLTYSFILNLEGRPDPLPPEETFPCLYGGFSLVVGAILLAFSSRWFGKSAGSGPLHQPPTPIASAKTSAAPPAEAGGNPAGQPGP